MQASPSSALQGKQVAVLMTDGLRDSPLSAIAVTVEEWDVKELRDTLTARHPPPRGQARKR